MRTKTIALITALLLTTSPAWASFFPSGTIAAPSTNTSGTITTGGTFQTIAASSTTRRSLEFQNLCIKPGKCSSTTNNCYVFIDAAGTPSTDNSKIIGPGQSYLRSEGVIPSDAIQATCDGTGDKYHLDLQ